MSSLRVLVEIHEGELIAMTLTKAQELVKPNRLRISDDLWWIHERQLDIRLGPWPFGAYAAHPMYPHILTMYDQRDLRQHTLMKHFLLLHGYPDFPSRS